MTTPIAIVGTGAVAQAVGRLLHCHGQPLAAVAGRSRLRAEQAAAFIGAGVAVLPIADLPRSAGRILVATADAGIAEVADVLAGAGFKGVALHTCGARGPEALSGLQRIGAACGVLHPLQTVVNPDQGVACLQGISFGLAGDPAAVGWGQEIVALAGGRAVAIDPGRMALYHAGAVLASNGMVALIYAAVRLMEQAGVERQAALAGLGPLARATLDNVLLMGPQAALTGPVARGEAGTVGLHLAALAAAPNDIGALYRSVGRSLLDLAERRGLPESSLRVIAGAFETGQTGDTHA